MGARQDLARTTGVPECKGVHSDTMILSRTTLLAAGAAGLAARQMSISRRVDMSAADLGTMTLRPVQNGAIRGSSVEAASLWRDNGALVFVVRRPG